MSESKTPNSQIVLDNYSLKKLVASDDTWKPPQYVPSGIAALDIVLGGGLRQGGTTLFVGHAGRGKTTTATQIAWMAARAGVPTCIFSLEMLAADQVKLIASQASGIARRGIDRWDLSIPQSQTLEAIRRDMSKWPLTILDSSCHERGLTRSAIEQTVRIGVEKLKWRLIVIDYLNLITSDAPDMTEYQNDVANSTSIKRIAQTNNVAILCIAALRKSANIAAKKQSRGEDSRPITLDDVLGAGRLVYDAVNVIHINASSDTNGSRVQLDILKSRYSAPHEGPLLLSWLPSQGRVGEPIDTEEIDALVIQNETEREIGAWHHEPI